MINLRQKLLCSYPESFSQLSGVSREWLTGTRRHIEDIQRLLAIEGLATDIEPKQAPKGTIVIGPETWHIDAVLNALKKLLHSVDLDL